MHLGSYNRVVKCGDSETPWFQFNSYQWFISDDIEHIKSFENHYEFKDRRRKLRLVLDCRFFSTDFIPEKNQIMEDEVGSVMNSLSEKTVNKKNYFSLNVTFSTPLEIVCDRLWPNETLR